MSDIRVSKRVKLKLNDNGGINYYEVYVKPRWHLFWKRVGAHIWYGQAFKQYSEMVEKYK
jgi:hypothetical protein